MNLLELVEDGLQVGKKPASRFGQVTEGDYVKGLLCVGVPATVIPGVETGCAYLHTTSLSPSLRLSA